MSWRDQLRPASFFGAAFWVDSHEWETGRRLAKHEFPYHDTPFVEDLGQKQEIYRIRGYVIADVVTEEYFQARDDLAAACKSGGPAATLVHPYLGSLKVYCDSVRMHESMAEGGMAIFDLVFVEGQDGSPVGLPDANANSLAGLASTLNALVNAVSLAVLIAERPQVLVGLAEGVLGSYAADLLGLPASIVGQIQGVVGLVVQAATSGFGPVTSSLTGAVGDPIAIAVTDAATATATAIVAAATAAPTPVDPVLGVSQTAIPAPFDPAAPLAPIAAFVPAIVPNGTAATAQGALSAALQLLIQGAGTLAIGQIYANTDFASSQAAATAAQTMDTLIGAQIEAADAANQPALYQAWLALDALVVTDLLARAQALPNVTPWSRNLSLPAFTLAQQLLEDGSQGLALAALNNAPHPLFMPLNGVSLAA